MCQFLLLASIKNRERRREAGFAEARRFRDHVFYRQEKRKLVKRKFFIAKTDLRKQRAYVMTYEILNHPPRQQVFCDGCSKPQTPK